jgi:curved DNA-binding protein CbpA
MTYYEVLGVSPWATAEEIKRAYHRLALLHHPDVQEDGDGSHRTMQSINDAWSVLGEPARRRAYDADLGTGGPPRPAAAPVDEPMAAETEEEESDIPFVEPEPRSPRRELFVLLPVILLAASVGCFALSLVMLAPALQVLAVVLLPLAGLCFVLVPMTAIRRQARRTYRS